MKKLTKNEYEKMYKEKNGNDYDILDFTSGRNPVKIYHKKCKKYFIISRANHLSSCPHCRQPHNKKDDIELKDIIEKDKDYTFIKRVKESIINIRHNLCHKDFNMKLSDFKRGQRCPYCRKNRSIDFDSFKKEIASITNNEYELIGKENSKFLIKHSCGHITKMMYFEFMNGRRCEKCTRTHKLKTTDEFKNELFNLVGNEYSLVGDYRGTNYKNEFIHNNNNCKGNGKIFMMKPNAFLNGERCPYCNGSFRKNINDFKKEVKEIGNDEYTVSGEYINNKTKINFFHKICRHHFLMRPDKFINGNRCPFCKSRKNEKEIMQYLEKLNINYLYDKPYIPYSKRERFDFQIFKDNKLYIIEYDGEFHYKPIFGEDRLQKQKDNDTRKNKYCKDNNIPLLRIPYTQQKEKENIINKFLVKHNILPSTTIEHII